MEYPQSRKPWSSDVSCTACNLTDLCLPGGMPENEVSLLSQLVRRNRTIQRGEYIYHAGDRYTGVFSLKSGTAKLVLTDRHGYESIIAVLLPGELQGFDGMATGRYQCSLIALEMSSYCELTSHDIAYMSSNTQGIHKLIQQKTCEQMDRYIQRIATSHRPAEERLAQFLVDLTQRYIQRGFSAKEVNLSLTRQEIGSHLGLALETVSRLLGKFEVSNIISVDRKKIQIMNMDALRTICGG